MGGRASRRPPPAASLPSRIRPSMQVIDCAFQGFAIDSSRFARLAALQRLDSMAARIAILGLKSPKTPPIGVSPNVRPCHPSFGMTKLSAMPLRDKAIAREQDRAYKRRLFADAREAGFVRVGVMLSADAVALIDSIKLEKGFRNRDDALGFALAELARLRSDQLRRSDP